MPIDKKVILDLLEVIGGDGHTIWDADADCFKEMPKDLMDRMTVVHKSDGTHKGSIFVGGKLVEELRGVNGLRLLWALASTVGADTKKAADKMGRGFQAHELTVAIKQKLREEA
jgi:hypothetical protein